MNGTSSYFDERVIYFFKKRNTDLVARAESRFQMLSASEASDSASNHNTNPVAESLALLHAMRVSNDVF